MRRTWLNSYRTPLAILGLWSALATGCEDAAAPSVGTGGTGGTGGNEPNSVATAMGTGGAGGNSNSSSTTRQSSGGEAGMAGAKTDSSASGGGTTSDPEPGDACAVPEVVSGTGFLAAGDSFTSKFQDDLALAHESCLPTEPGSSDAVFQVTLEADEELWVTQTGHLDAALSIQHECGSEKACGSSGDDRSVSVRYAATARETVYVVVEAIQAAPRREDYAIHIDIDPECGNGSFEGPEQCDDQNSAASDGCAPDCSIEFPYFCDAGSPSQCERYPSIGEVGADASLEFEDETQLESEAEIFRTVTFTERLVATLELAPRRDSVGIVDAILYSDWDVTEWVGNSSEIEEVGLEPGTYLVRFIATTPLPEGFEFKISTRNPPECGNGVPEPPFEQCDNGGQLGCSEDCSVDFGYECEGEEASACTPIDPIGEFGAGDPISDTDYPYAIDPGTSHYRMIRFLEPVSLSASVIGIEPEARAGNYVSRVRLTNQNKDLLIDQPVTASPFTGLSEVVEQPLPADLYQIEVFTDTGLPEGYSMTLSTQAP